MSENKMDSVEVGRENRGTIGLKGVNEKESVDVNKDDKNLAKNILANFFSRKLDKNGNVKSAKLIKKDLNALLSIKGACFIDDDFISSLSKDILLTDPSLRCLKDLALSVVSENKGEWHKELFGICVKVASSVWQEGNEENKNIFENLLGSDKSSSNCLSLLESRLDRICESRQDKSTNKAKKNKEEQKRNLLILGTLWLLQEGCCNIQDVIDYLNRSIVRDYGVKSTLREMVIFLAKQWGDPDQQVASLIAIQAGRYDKSQEDLKRAKDFIKQKDHKISGLEQSLSIKSSEVEKLSAEGYKYRKEIEDLKRQMEDHQLDERAVRTRLRDNESRVKARAFNLLSDDVLEPLRLSLSALQRDNPKTKVAIHQIELALGSIEKELKWFKE